MLWLVGGGVQRWVSDNSHMRCRMGMVVWGRMCGNMDMGESLDHCLEVNLKPLLGSRICLLELGGDHCRD